MQHLEDLKQKAQQWKDQLTKTPLERALSEATANVNWNTPTRVSQEIADATYSYTDCNIVMKYIWKRLNSDNKEWRRVLKTLNLIEYLIKNGAPRCVGEFKEEIFKIRTYSDYCLIEDGGDKGIAIREKTKQILDLLSNEKLIEEERESAKRIKERLNAVGGAQAISSDNSYVGYGSGSTSNWGNAQTSYGSQASSNQNKSSENDYAKKYGVYQESTSKGSNLDKYRSKPEQPATSNGSQVTGPELKVVQEQSSFGEIKKPFQEPAKKLIKPGEEWTVPKLNQPQAQSSWNVPQTAQQPKPTVTTNQSASLIDFDEPQPQTKPLQPPQQQQPQTQNNNWANFVPSTQQPQIQTQPQVDFNAFGAFQQQSQQTTIKPIQQPQQQIPVIQPPVQQQLLIPQIQPPVQQQPNIASLNSLGPVQQTIPQQTQPQPTQPNLYNIMPQQQQFPQQQQYPQQQVQPQYNYNQPQVQNPLQQFPQQQQLPMQQSYPQQQIQQPQQQFPYGVPPQHQMTYGQPGQVYQIPQASQQLFTPNNQPQNPQHFPTQAPQYNQGINQFPQYQRQTIYSSPQTQKTEDFLDFQSSNQVQNVKSLEDKLVDLADLTREVKEQKKQPQPQQNPNNYQQPQTQLYTSQMELDTFQLNYRHK